MSITDVINYTLFNNPISANSIHIAKSAVAAISEYSGLQTKPVEIKMISPEPLWKLSRNTGPFIRIAALSGAAAVSLGAYGSHRHYPEETGQDLKRAFEVASRFHFFHTLAFLSLPLARRPYIVAAFMGLGTFLFCGGCYYYAFTGDRTFSRVTPIGGTCLILGWLALAL